MTGDAPRRGSIPAAWFEAEYARDPDPWRFATSEYEQAKYADTLAALGARRFVSGFEVGCSIGVFTAQLARHCDRLLAVDVAESALSQARQACISNPSVRFATMRVPDQWPEDSFDLILLAEVLYYLDAAEIERVGRQVLRTLRPGGVALLVHWTGPTDYPCSGDEAAERFIAVTSPAIAPVTQARRERYRLDRLDRG